MTIQEKLSNLDTFHQARDNAYGTLTSLQYIQDACYTLGMDRLADKIYGFTNTLVNSLNTMDECFANELNGRFEDSKKFTGDVLGLVLAMSTKEDKQ